MREPSRTDEEREAQRVFNLAMSGVPWEYEVLAAGEVLVRVQNIARLPWRTRPWPCRLGLHPFGNLTTEDICSASQFCPGCGHIKRFSGKALVACIQTRPELMLREYA